MKCDGALEAMHEALDGEGSLPAEAADHVEGCPACALAWEELRGVEDFLRVRGAGVGAGAVVGVDTGARLQRRVLAALEKEQTHGRRRSGIRMARRVYAAACLGAVVLGISFLGGRPEQGEAPALISAAVEAHPAAGSLSFTLPQLADGPVLEKPETLAGVQEEVRDLGDSLLSVASSAVRAVGQE